MSTEITGGDKTTALSTDRKHELLSNARRRRVIVALAEADSLTKAELADRLAEKETDGRVGSQDRKRVMVALHQCHLPKLIDSAVVEETADGYQLGVNGGPILPLVDELPRRKRGTALLSTAMGRY